MQRGRPPSVHPGFVLILLAGLVVEAGTAGADDKKRSVTDGDKVDVSKIANHLVFAHDGNGHYIAGTPGLTTDELYYGDGKTFYKQTVIGGGSNGGTDENSWTYFEPRLARRGALERKQSVWTVTCGKREVSFNEVSEKDRKKLVKSKFKPFKFRRRPHALLRDRRGTYYFVDKVRIDDDDVADSDYRLFVGRRGKMTKFKLVDIVDDSEGQIFLTKGGDLHLVIDKTEKITWTKEKEKPEELKKLPLFENLQLIYTELGPYESERLGTPCDDL